MMEFSLHTPIYSFAFNKKNQLLKKLGILIFNKRTDIPGWGVRDRKV